MSEENQQQYAPEELAKMRAKMTTFYKEEAKHLQPQATYYKLLAEIEENKVRRYAAMQQGAHMFAQAEAAEAEQKAQELADEEARLAEAKVGKEPAPKPAPKKASKPKKQDAI